MAHFAQIDENNIVIQIIVADQEFINSGAVGDPTKWIQTGKDQDGNLLRKNYAGIGFSYDPQRDAFIPPKIYPSWILDEETCLWKPPSEPPMNDNMYYVWDEPTTSWKAISIG